MGCYATPIRATPVAQESARAREQARSQPLSISVENDTLSNSDDAYSNGAALSWATAEVSSYPADSFFRSWLDLWSFLPGVGDPSARHFLSWSLAQEIHTPNDITDPTPPDDVQPYAGMLYVDNTIYYMNEADRYGQVFNLRVGTVGPAARAEEVQTGVHRAIGSEVPEGWDTQLPNELLLNLDYTYGYYAAGHEPEGEFGWRCLPTVTASLGTYFTGVNALLFGEIGQNLSSGVASGTLRGGLKNTSVVGASTPKGWSYSLFGAIGGYSIAHYLPVDGTVFRDSHSLDSNPFVGQISAGITVRRAGFTLAHQKILSTDVYEDQSEDNTYGSLTISWNL